MPRRAVQIMTTVAGLALSACANPGNTTTPPVQETSIMELTSEQKTPQVVTTGELKPAGDPSKAAQMNIKPVEWPLRFNRHNFDARCFDTLECSVSYDGFDFGTDKPTATSASKGPDYLKGWTGSFGIHNFPPPAKLTWRSKDGSTHEAEIDIGDIFKDRLVRHNVPREEAADLPDGKYESQPSILLEVNDRTIRVYMRAMVYTKHLQRPESKLSNYRDDLVLVKTYTY